MKIYTKKGDAGETSLIGGKRVKKNHPRVEAYGTVDELMAHTAMLMDMLTDENDKKFLMWTLEKLMTTSSVLAVEGEIVRKIPQITKNDITNIENRIDEMNENLKPVDGFILPGGNVAASQCHIARTVCRRTERRIIDIVETGNNVPVEILGLVNRLSDYFFVLSRKIIFFMQKNC